MTAKRKLAAAPIAPLAYGVDELCVALGNIGRSTFYRLVAKGEFHPFKVGSKTLVDAREIEAFISRQKSAQIISKS